MRRFAGNDRLIHNEITSAAVDAPENETFVESGVEPSTPADLEIQIASGDVFIEGSPVSVSSQTETVTDVSDEVTESAYRYHTVSVDPTGTLVVNTSPTGEFDPETPSEPPITQVTEPTHPAGNCFIGTAFQVNDQIERVYDGRYIIGELPNSIITQGEGSGLTAEFVDPQGEGSGLDADTVRGATAWTDANDGEGSGLDADTVDGIEGDVLNSLTYQTDSGSASQEAGDDDGGGSETIDTFSAGLAVSAELTARVVDTTSTGDVETECRLFARYEDGTRDEIQSINENSRLGTSTGTFSLPDFDYDTASPIVSYEIDIWWNSFTNDTSNHEIEYTVVTIQ